MPYAPRPARPPLAPRLAAGLGVVLAVALGLLASVAVAQRFDPPVGAELLITDERSETLIGFGRVEGDGVTLELSSDEPGTWRVVVVTPDGTSRPYDARWNGERLTLAPDGAPPFDAADALGPQGRTLTLTWWDGGATEVPTDRFVARPSDPEPGAAPDVTEADAPDVPDSNRPARPATASRDDGDDDAGHDDPAPPPVAEEPADDAPADDAPDAGANRPGGNAGDDDGDDGAQDDGSDAPPPSSNR
ncbi:MAG: hypothetical protein RI554_10635 [Trueperaceae bacterium]|nr:hypothetical protein [Trueperaceae bacterium]